jgi:hypothetical protein
LRTLKLATGKHLLLPLLVALLSAIINRGVNVMTDIENEDLRVAEISLDGNFARLQVVIGFIEDIHNPVVLKAVANMVKNCRKEIETYIETNNVKLFDD